MKLWGFLWESRPFKIGRRVLAARSEDPAALSDGHSLAVGDGAALKPKTRDDRKSIVGIAFVGVDRGHEVAPL
jgi:hypothetical protein